MACGLCYALCEYDALCECALWLVLCSALGAYRFLGMSMGS
jgi:hypothetical protein